MNPLQPNLYIKYPQKTYRIAQNAVPYSIHDNDLQNNGVTYDHNLRRFMSIIGSLPIGEVK